MTSIDFDLSKITERQQFEVFLGAGRCTAQGELPLQSLVRYMIDAATVHANRLDFGYAYLIKRNCSWVLSRLAVEMKEFPRINDTLKLTTWVVSTNRLYSDRAFLFENGKGETVGYGISTWVAIDLGKRKPANLLELFPNRLPDMNCQPPIAPFTRQKPIEPTSSSTEYRFAYTDIDCNRHVTTGRYIELMLNSFSVDYFDHNKITRFEIAFHAEARYDDKVEIRTITENRSTMFEIARESQVLTHALLETCER